MTQGHQKQGALFWGILSMQRHARKLEELKSKKLALQEKEDKIKSDILNAISETLIKTQAIEIDFFTLVGGILDVVEKAKQGDKITEVWKQAGQKFCKVRTKKTSGKDTTLATKVKTNKSATK